METSLQAFQDVINEFPTMAEIVGAVTENFFKLNRIEVTALRVFFYSADPPLLHTARNTLV